MQECRNGLKGIAFYIRCIYNEERTAFLIVLRGGLKSAEPLPSFQLCFHLQDGPILCPFKYFHENELSYSIIRESPRKNTHAALQNGQVKSLPACPEERPHLQRIAAGKSALSSEQSDAII